MIMYQTQIYIYTFILINTRNIEIEYYWAFMCSENGSQKNWTASESFAMSDLRHIFKYWSKQTSSLKKQPPTKDDKNKRMCKSI